MSPQEASPISSLPVIGTPAGISGHKRLPPWLKKPLPSGSANTFTHNTLRELKLETVCENARCPNRPECYSRKTATFMILGNVCTRPCGFCAVARGKPVALEDDEPQRLAKAAARLGLRHVVITSVTRDDLPDGGADHFYRCVLAVRRETGAVVEVLTPDFVGNHRAIDRVLQARPEVFNHNLETVPRLYDRVRRNADYARSLQLLARVKHAGSGVMTKSGIMVGLGESWDEVIDLIGDLRRVGCDILTVGQYLRPSPDHLPVESYWPPSEFERLKQLAERIGFRHVASGPFVRSSYHADEQANPAASESVER